MKIFNKLRKIILYSLIRFYLGVKLLGKGIKPIWIGNNYGGFFVDVSNLKGESIIYSFGIGEDISFDKELIKKTKAKVYGFDPTPKSIEWVKENKVNNFIFFDYGIGIKNESTKMYLPKNKDHVSGSIIKTKNLSEQYVNIELKTLDKIMDELEHNHIDLLKLDIEGLEYQVLDYIVAKKIKINQIVLEFHDRFVENGVEKRKKLMKRLRGNGYVLFAISKNLQEYSFICKSLIK